MDPLELWFEPIDGELTQVDLAATAVVAINLQISYSHPAQLRWSMLVPQHEIPIPSGSFIRLLSGDHDSDDPLFEGWVRDIQPAGSCRVNYVACDPTERASREIPILSGPASSENSIARLVFNVMNDQDDDRTFQVEKEASVKEILERLFEDASEQLAERYAGREEETNLEGIDDFDYVPQDKIVFESQTLRVGIDRMLRFYPSHRLLYHPGSEDEGRTWCVVNVRESPALTLTLNQSAGDTPSVLSLRLDRSVLGRYTAVRIDGPQKMVLHQATMLTYESEEFSEVDSGLMPLWDDENDDHFPTDEIPPPDPLTHQRWQIADPEKRQIARQLPSEVFVPLFSPGTIGYGSAFQRTRQPVLLANYGSGYEIIHGFEILDAGRGIIGVPYLPYQRTDGTVGPGRLPEDVKLIYAYLGEPLTARFPEVGFEGTAFDLANIACERRIYDESFVVGYENGDPEEWISETERVEQFTLLAENLHRASSDIVYTGGAVLDDIDLRFLRLDRRVHITAVDRDGQLMETGWEEIGAVVTDVEFDFDAGVTTLTFSSDQMELTQTSPEQVKRSLRVMALRPTSRTPRFFVSQSYTPIAP